MIDIHSHVLPGIDDGSKNTEMSLQMLAESKRQGVDLMFLTPHFYADMTDPDTFTERRARAELKLREAVKDDPQRYPNYILGAEVHYFRGIGRSEEIERLCMGNSRYILLEPPFRTWKESFLEDVRLLRDEQDLKVIIAHIERYFDQDRNLVEELLEEPGIYIQSNGEIFLDFWGRKRPLKLLEEGKIHFLGSDCHNMGHRPPNLAQARELIGKKIGREALQRIDRNSIALVDEAR